MGSSTGTDLRRRVPAVDQALARVAGLVERHGREVVLRELRRELEALRELAARGDEAALDAALAQLEGRTAERLTAASRPSLRRVINATGVIVHTNLGRAPLARHVVERIAEVAAGYSNLEYDVARGGRGQREIHAERRLRQLLGSEAVVVVNNNAAAVMLAVNTFAEGREVIVSRGELVEIGGSFRIPDVLRKGGARLVEVGTTNRTRLEDYRAALGPATGLILKVHPSNFAIVGFTESPELRALAELGREAGVPVVEDLGSGLIERLPPPLEREATVGERLASGVDAVTFSGDKLLGGPQAGLVAGRADRLDRMRRNPLYRALRVDKLTLAGLDAVLVDHDAGRGAARVPVLEALARDVAGLERRAGALAARLRAACPGVPIDVLPGESAVGGGALPTAGLETRLVAVGGAQPGAEALAARLRDGDPPVVGRIEDDRLLLDLRTVAETEDDELAAAVGAALDG